MKSVVKNLVDILKEKNLTIALAESVTCGLATHQLNTVKGTSDILIGSIVCYNENVKKTVLGVNATLIKKFTTESKQVTNALVKNLKRLFNAKIYVAITGLASPGASEKKSKPVGTIFFSILYKKRLFHSKKKFTGSPLEIKKKSCKYLYEFLVSIL